MKKRKKNIISNTGSSLKKFCRVLPFVLMSGFFPACNNNTATVDKEDTGTSSYQQVKDDLTRGWNTWSNYSLGQHVLLPTGATINFGLYKKGRTDESFANRFRVDKKAEGDLNPIVRPGYHSYNGDYTEMEVTYRNDVVKVETAANGDDFYMLVTPVALDTTFRLIATFEGGILWNKPGKVQRNESSLQINPENQSMEFFATEKPLEGLYVNSISPFLGVTLSPGQQVGLSNTTKDLSAIKSAIDEKRGAYKQQTQKYGELADVYAGMSSCLAWNTIYDIINNRVFTTVDREWNIIRGGYVFFGWDNFFMAQMIGIDHKKLAMANAIEALNEATEEGFVSNLSQANSRKAWDRSQPPVGGMMCWEIYKKHPEKWFLEEVYPKLLKWNQWWMKKRLNGDLISLGSHKSKNPFKDWNYNSRQAAMLESGIDDSPMYVESTFNKERGLMELHDVGMNAMYIGDCIALAEMASVLGKDDEAKMLRERAETFQKNIQALWNEENGLFQNYDLVKEAFVDRISPTSFYPMIARTATREQAEIMVRKHLLNEDEFWGEWIIPSISRDDPMFKEQRYWRGAIWAPMNFLTYMGLREYDLDVTDEFVDKSIAIFRKNWNEKRFVCENYSPIDGTCTHEELTSSPWYTWGGMMVIIGLMEKGYYNQPNSLINTK